MAWVETNVSFLLIIYGIYIYIYIYIYINHTMCTYVKFVELISYLGLYLMKLQGV